MDYTTATSINLARLLKEGGRPAPKGWSRRPSWSGRSASPCKGRPLGGSPSPPWGGTSTGSPGRWRGWCSWSAAAASGPPRPGSTPTSSTSSTTSRASEEVVFHEEGEEEFYAFGLPDLDLLPFLTEAFVTEMPYTVLCEEGCKGLCPVCGADRNVEDCGHEPEAFHPFLGLKDLLPEL